MDRRSAEIKRRLEESERQRQQLELQLRIMNYYILHFLATNTTHPLANIRAEIDAINKQIEKSLLKINEILNEPTVYDSDSSNSNTEQLLKEAITIANLETDTIERADTKITIHDLMTVLSDYFDNDFSNGKTCIELDVDRFKRILRVLYDTVNQKCSVKYENEVLSIQFEHSNDIPDNVISVLNDPFSSSNLGSYNRLDDVGLQLFIAKSLVDAIQGEFILEKGLIICKFGARQLSAEECKSDAFQKVPEMPTIHAPAPVPTVTPAPTPVTSSSSEHPKKHFPPFLNILLVEDDNINQKLFSRIWYGQKETAANIVVAGNGSDAIDLFKQQRFSIVFMDIQLPGSIDGVDATKEIRVWEKANKRSMTPIVALSGAGEKEKRMMEAGMDDFLPKPYRWGPMRDIVLKYCGV